MAKENFTVNVDVTSPADRKSIQSGLENFASIPFSDRERVNEIISNKKALKALEENWSLLKLKIKLS